MNAPLPTIRRLGSLAALALGLAGCVVGPDDQRPSVALTARFQTAAPSAAELGPSVDLAVWWRSFEDPKLSAVVERAGAQNLDLAQAQARLAQSRALARAASSALLPTGALAGSASAVRQSLDSPIGEIGRHLPGFSRRFDEVALSASASWDIGLFGGLHRAREAALAEAAASAFEAEAVRIAVEADAADAYIEVRADQARLAVARRQADVEADLVTLLARLVGQGVSPERELHEAEAELERVRASLPPLTNALEDQLNRLDVLMGAQPGSHRAELGDGSPLPAPPRLAAGSAPAELLRRRPDVLAAEAQVTAANARIGAALADYYPKASLQGLLGVDSLGVGPLFTGGALQHAVSAGMSWRLFDFGRIDAEVAAARGRHVEALAAYRATVFKAAEEVEDAFSAMTEQEARASHLNRQIAALTLSRAQAETAYEGGVISLLEVRDADRDLLLASDARIQALAGADLGAIAAFRALGGGWSGASPPRELLREPFQRAAPPRLSP